MVKCRFKRKSDNEEEKRGVSEKEWRHRTLIMMWTSSRKDNSGAHYFGNKEWNDLKMREKKWNNLMYKKSKWCVKTLDLKIKEKKQNKFYQ